MPSRMVTMSMGDDCKRHLAPGIQPQIASWKMDAVPHPHLHLHLHTYAFASGNSRQSVV